MFFKMKKGWKIKKENNPSDVSVFDVANFFISKSIPGTNFAVTPHKLQKLVYYAQGFYLAIKGRPLFSERFEAWTHGPACPKLYSHFRSKYLQELKPIETPTLPSDIEKVLEVVWKTYSPYDGDQLEQVTHKEEPWLLARGKKKPWESCTKEITQDSIRTFFEKELFDVQTKIEL